MLKRSKTDKNAATSEDEVIYRSNRVLVVDDNEDAGRLLGKIVRRAGYEVAEMGDHQVAIATLVNETQPVGAVIASFTTTGTGACLRLLDAIRSHTEPKICELRVMLVSDQPRQQIFCLQAGADAIMLRPYHSTDLLDELSTMIERPDEDRMPYRRRTIELLKRTTTHDLDPTIPSPREVSAAHFS